MKPTTLLSMGLLLLLLLLVDNIHNVEAKARLNKMSRQRLTARAKFSNVRPINKRIGREVYSNIDTKDGPITIELTVTDDTPQPKVSAVRNLFTKDSTIQHSSESVPESSSVTGERSFTVTYLPVCSNAVDCATTPRPIKPLASFTESYVFLTDYVLLRKPATDSDLPLLAYYDPFPTGAITPANFVSLSTTFTIAKDLLSSYTQWTKVIVASEAPKADAAQVDTLEELQSVFAPLSKTIVTRLRTYKTKLDLHVGEALPASATNLKGILPRMANAVEETFERITFWGKQMTTIKKAEAESATTSGAGNSFNTPAMQAAVKAKPTKVEETITSLSDAAADGFVGFLKGKVDDEIAWRTAIPNTNPLYAYYQADVAGFQSTKTYLDSQKSKIAASLAASASSNEVVTDTVKFGLGVLTDFQRWGDDTGKWFKDLFSKKKKEAAVNAMVASGVATRPVKKIDVGEDELVKDLADASLGPDQDKLIADLKQLAPSTPTTPTPSTDFKFKYDIKFAPDFKPTLVFNEILKKIGATQTFTIANDLVTHTVKLDVVVESPFDIERNGDLKVKLAWERKEAGPTPLNTKIELAFSGIQEFDDKTGIQKRTILTSAFASLDKTFSKNSVLQKLETGLFVSCTIPFTKDSTGTITRGAAEIQIKPSFQINFRNDGNTKLIFTSDIKISGIGAAPTPTIPNPTATLTMNNKLTLSHTFGDYDVLGGVHYNMLPNGANQYGFEVGARRTFDLRLPNSRTNTKVEVAGFFGVGSNPAFNVPSSIINMPAYTPITPTSGDNMFFRIEAIVHF